MWDVGTDLPTPPGRHKATETHYIAVFVAQKWLMVGNFTLPILNIKAGPEILSPIAHRSMVKST